MLLLRDVLSHVVDELSAIVVGDGAAVLAEVVIEVSGEASEVGIELFWLAELDRVYGLVVDRRDSHDDEAALPRRGRPHGF